MAFRLVVQALVICSCSALHTRPEFNRPLNLLYGKNATYNQSTTLSYIDEIQPPITMALPLLADCANLTGYESILMGLLQRNITIVPGIGNASNETYGINSTYYKQMAANFRQYTSWIEIEDAQGYFNQGYLANITDMVEYLNETLRFRHIGMNPWPSTNASQENAPRVSFGNSAVDFSIQQVQPGSWQANMLRAELVMNISSNLEVLVNYEDPPEEQALAALSLSDQIQAMNSTVVAIHQNFTGQYSGRVHWMPPFSKAYNPVAQGTWEWMKEQLEQM